MAENRNMLSKMIATGKDLNLWNLWISCKHFLQRNWEHSIQ
jgi:hypothetical protein